MSALSSLLEKFHGAILTKDAATISPAIKNNARISPERQLAIYIDGYRIRLTAAIRSDYPALLALLGDKAFDALAREYIERNAPAHFSLDRYPHGFAAFVSEHRNDAFAAEVAALEAAIAEIFIMEESEPLDPSALTGLAPETFGAFMLRPRTASRLLSFAYPTNDWLHAQRESNKTDRPAPEKTYLYVYRHQNEVQRAPLNEPAYLLLRQFTKGLSVAAAFDAVETAHPEQCEVIAAHLQLWFSEWLQKGFFRQ
jgi:Putative DNA-binding domain